MRVKSGMKKVRLHQEKCVKKYVFQLRISLHVLLIVSFETRRPDKRPIHPRRPNRLEALWQYEMPQR